MTEKLDVERVASGRDGVTATSEKSPRAKSVVCDFLSTLSSLLSSKRSGLLRIRLVGRLRLRLPFVFLLLVELRLMSRKRSKTWLSGRLLVRVLEGVRERGRRKGLADEVLRERGARAGDGETKAVMEGVSAAGSAAGAAVSAVVWKVLLLLERSSRLSVSICSGSSAC